uniref:Peptidase_S9 domain-containing protein n=1 Tax=Angiostrongylus cantonensis TaxID=6313 RepID=A0A158P706_ANGCA
MDGESSNILLEPMFNIDQFKYSNGILSPVEIQDKLSDSSASDFVFDAQFCPCDSRIVSYVVNKQIHIERDSSIIYKTPNSDPNVSNGVSAFITQEELDRFQAVWWSPTSTRLLYERVDETSVRSLMFVCPGREAAPPMKYPVAGTDNAISQLRIIMIDGNAVVDCGLKEPLKSRFPWVEYIARAGFLSDGKTVWVQVLNRTQSQASLILLPESEFEGFRSTGPILNASIVKNEVSSAWINTHNSIVPLDSNISTIEFIYASEQQSQCHLYVISASVVNHEIVGLRERVVTEGDFSVCKATNVVLDKDRQLVYYIANVGHPTEWSVCVSSYSESVQGMRRLTESGASFKWIPFQKYTKLGFVVVMLDGRGSSNRGTDFEFPIFGKLGQCEVEDQVEGLREVAQIMDGMLDLTRVVVQGWSYGGYMSLLALAKYPQIFRAAIAGGAVTDWKLYDTAYTERYLGYGEDRDPFYEESSVIKHVDKLPDQPGRLLLVHGLLDENVHFRHTEVLIEQLIKAGKPYQLQLFPSERHGIRSSDGAAYLDASILNFIQQALKD